MSSTSNEMYKAISLSGAHKWNVIAGTGGGGAGAWGAITGTLSDQTDLQSALNGKQSSLVSGTNIKTVNGNSLVGSGDVAVGSTNSNVGSGYRLAVQNTNNIKSLTPGQFVKIDSTSSTNTLGIDSTTFPFFIPTVPDIPTLESKGISDNNQFILKDVGIFEYRASGTPDGSSSFAANGGGIWLLVTNNVGPSTFSDLAQLAGTITDNNKWVKFGTAIIRFSTVTNNDGTQVYRKQGQSFTWTTVDQPWNNNDTHRKLFTDTAISSGASGIQVNFANTRAVIYGSINMDESLAQFGMVGGGTIANANADFRVFKQENHTYQFTDAQITSLNAGTEITLSKRNSSTNAYIYTGTWDDTKLKYDASTGLFTLRSFGVNSWTRDASSMSPIIEWAGADSMYWARPVIETRDMTESSGTVNWPLSTAWQKKFYLVNHLGQIRTTALRSTDNLNIIQNGVWEHVPHAAADGRAAADFQKNIFVSSGGTLRNYWCLFIMEIWADTYNVTGSSDIMVHWQQFRNGSGIATSYRLQEATLANYSDAVDIYTGSALQFRDSSPQKYYRLYATVGGVESLVTSFNRKLPAR
ncbi:hypothetical protein [Flavihumibacter petaseus]|nr:hypothetical protein [Flavihumibacter petaseus]